MFLSLAQHLSAIFSNFNAVPDCVKDESKVFMKMNTPHPHEFLHLKKAVTKIILEISYEQNMVTVRYTVENSNAARRSASESRICWIFSRMVHIVCKDLTSAFQTYSGQRGIWRKNTLKLFYGQTPT